MILDRPSLRRSVSVHGPRPADDVWDRYVRPQRWPEWSPQIRSVVYPAATLSPGTTGVVRGPAGLRVDFRIVDVDAAGPVRSWSWAVSALGVRMELRHTVQATATGTRTGLTVRGFAPAVVLYLPVAHLALRRLVQAS
jgi:polyketide cyclase/dehydrase/lipid transport protein